MKQLERPFGQFSPSKTGSHHGSTSPGRAGLVTNNEDFAHRVNCVKMTSPQKDNSMDAMNVSPCVTPTKRNICNSPRSQAIYDPGNETMSGKLPIFIPPATKLLLTRLLVRPSVHLQFSGLFLDPCRY